jgi:HemY protein
MRALLWLVLIAALAVGLSLAARYNEGYVLLVVPPWRVEVTLNLLLILLVAAFGVGYGLLRGLATVLSLPRAVREYRARRAHDKADAGLRDAVRFFYEGRYGHARKLAETAFEAGHAPGLAALVAWRAAHALRDQPAVAYWRLRAEGAGAGMQAAWLMTEAELALDARQYPEAREALNRLAAGEGRHIAALRLSLRTHQGLGDWRQVLHLVRQLEKHQALTPDQAAPIRLRAHRENIAALREDAAQINRYWRDMPSADRGEPRLVLETAKALGAAGDCVNASRLIEDFLDEQWDSSLIGAYADCAGGDTVARIAHAEKWLLSHPRDAQLLFALGRLCRQRQLWGKAQSYLEASLGIEPSRACHVELAQLLDHLDKAAEADQYYRKAAVLP